jgi:hypothetical protein
MEILCIIFTYDITCQYYKNFWNRMRLLPEYLHLQIAEVDMLFFVPNFHLPPHKEPCHGPFSLHFARGVRMSNGEGIEQNWENSNGAANQTKQMGISSCQDTLDHILGVHNYRKSLALAQQNDFQSGVTMTDLQDLVSGRILLKRMVEVINQSVKHRKAFNEFTSGLDSAQAGLTLWWRADEHEWQEDCRKLAEEQMKPSPYRVLTKGAWLRFEMRTPLI